MNESLFKDMNHCQEIEWKIPAKGSSSIKILNDANSEKEYFFKLSNERYPLEVFSEVLASHLGKLLGLNMLSYSFGEFQGLVGSVSENMIQNENFQLYHGVDLLKDCYPGFKLSEKPVYSAEQLSVIAASNHHFYRIESNLLKVAIFDFIIGNTDRHLDNWGYIWNIKADSKRIKKVKRTIVKFISFLPSNIKHFLLKRRNTFLHEEFKFSPIFDSASSLGRENSEAKIKQLLSDNNSHLNYISRCKSEMRWSDEKESFLSLFQNYATNKGDFFQSTKNELLLHLIEDRVQNEVAEIAKVGRECGLYISTERENYIVLSLLKRVELLNNI